MSDIVFIRGLKLPTIIGVYGWEREVRQELLVDLEMAWDIAPAGASDDVTDALDYSAVATRLREFAAESSFELIEKMATELAELVMREFSVPWLRLRVCKPGAVTEAVDVGVLIERGSRPA
ncbi:dihydroneopterin aldolase [Congregibacter sp.]|uniref:dihydroneopterin aldolase n=1 Tax=Congregibacter sp. TaxID=2744308 RepID=UPI00385CBE07